MSKNAVPTVENVSGNMLHNEGLRGGEGAQLNVIEILFCPPFRELFPN
jgi:hypothetical protein